MIELLKFMAELINNAHDIILDIVSVAGYEINDKKLHFIAMAIIGSIILIITQFIFKRLAKYSITAISFIYTFTVMIVVVFAIEIQQKLTNRGNMEFTDILYGIYGFIYAFAIYLIVKIIYKITKMLIVNFNNKRNEDECEDKYEKY